MAVPQNEQLLSAAIAHHQAGRLADAEALYRRVLAADPKNVQGLQYLGVLAHQFGRHDAAIELIGKAIALNDRTPDFHYNIGAALQAAGRLDDAAAHYSKAIALNASFAEAHYELANVLARQGKFSQAEAQYRRLLVRQPNTVEALINLGNVLMAQGNRVEAVACWRKALVFRPNNLTARMNLGLALKNEGKPGEAVTQLRQVVALKPDFADAHYNLGVVLQTLDQTGEAAEAYRRALTHQPSLIEALKALVALLLDNGEFIESLERARRAFAADNTPETRSLLISCLRSPLANPSVIDLRGELVRALSEPWGRPAELAYACASFVRLNPAIRDGIARTEQAWPQQPEVFSAADLIAIAQDPLLRTFLETTPVCDTGMERLLTAVRFNLLVAADSTPGDPQAEALLGFSCALARQCFINSYVFAQSDTEAERASALGEALAAALANQATIPALTVVAVAAYIPLHTLPRAAALLDREWPDAVAALLAQQVSAPLAERQLRASVPALTTIEDQVSLEVRDQYEESPYPQWSKLAPTAAPEYAAVVLRKKLLHSPVGEIGHGGAVDILVAGCGTGQQSIESALRYKNAQVLAVDLSLASLSYAQRQSRALGLHTIQYAQADIMQLPSIGRTFDIIESAGVLHHLADPFAGWRGLLTMLKPGGVMLLGFYSKIARADVAAARDFIAERGYRPMAEDIRRCRQDLLECADGTPLKNVVMLRDFFSLNECRDLLFHVQEHTLTLPEIADFIAENDLEFLGFEIDLSTSRNYARRFPADTAMTNLTQWHEYEIDNPRTFLSMYQFFVRKRPAA